MVQKPKPYPDIYLKVLHQNNLKKEETVIIEDSSVGVKAGVAAGIKVIGLIAGSHWHEDRSEEELINSGAFKVVKEYKYLDSVLSFTSLQSDLIFFSNNAIISFFYLLLLTIQLKNVYLFGIA